MFENCISESSLAVTICDRFQTEGRRLLSALQDRRKSILERKRRREERKKERERKKRKRERKEEKKK